MPAARQYLSPALALLLAVAGLVTASVLAREFPLAALSTGTRHGHVALLLATFAVVGLADAALIAGVRRRAHRASSDAPAGRARERLRLRDGAEVPLDRDLVIGRDLAEVPYVAARKARALELGTEPTVSHLHAEIRVQPGGAFLIDLKSRNGTLFLLPGGSRWIRLVPGEPLKLRAGMKIACGDCEMTVEE